MKTRSQKVYQIVTKVIIKTKPIPISNSRKRSNPISIVSTKYDSDYDSDLDSEYVISSSEYDSDEYNTSSSNSDNEQFHNSKSNFIIKKNKKPEHINLDYNSYDESNTDNQSDTENDPDYICSEQEDSDDSQWDSNLSDNDEKERLDKIQYFKNLNKQKKLNLSLSNQLIQMDITDNDTIVNESIANDNDTIINESIANDNDTVVNESIFNESIINDTYINESIDNNNLITCEGCKYDRPGQRDHMDYGGCLYMDY